MGMQGLHVIAHHWTSLREDTINYGIEDVGPLVNNRTLLW